jgi:hypothetical protein
MSKHQKVLKRRWTKARRAKFFETINRKRAEKNANPAPLDKESTFLMGADWQSLITEPVYILRDNRLVECHVKIAIEPKEKI